MDPQLPLLLADAATVWPGNGAVLLRGQPNHCHGNAAAAFLERWPKYLVGTGYALNDDGVWVQHSWLFEHAAGIPTRVVETTVRRLLYAGIALDPAGVANPIDAAFLPGGIETMRFCLSNIDTLDRMANPDAAADAAVRRDPRFLAVLAHSAGQSMTAEQLEAAMSRLATPPAHSTARDDALAAKSS
jgi:hypothetical protein